MAIAQLEHELAEIEQYVLSPTEWSYVDLRHETTIAELSKERDTVIRSNKEIKTKFITLDAWMHDYAKVCWAVSKLLLGSRRCRELY